MEGKDVGIDVGGVDVGEGGVGVGGDVEMGDGVVGGKEWKCGGVEKMSIMGGRWGGVGGRVMEKREGVGRRMEGVGRMVVELRGRNGDGW